MRNLKLTVFSIAVASLLSACAPTQENSAKQQVSAQASAVQTAQGCKAGEMVYMAGSRLKQPCGSAPVQSGTAVGSGSF